MSELQTGGCLCGAVRFTAQAADHFHACHCDSCKRWSGGVYLGVDVGDSLNVEDDASLSYYNSSAWAKRGFCKLCGSTLFWSAPDFGVMYVAYNAFDVAPKGEFQQELYIDKKPSAYSFAQSTQQMTKAEVEAMFAGDNG